jgi:hypothetical protein
MAGKIQNADIKSLTELTGLGATKVELLNTDKMYSPKTDNVLETDLRKNNDAATTDPAVGNDSSQNYEPGSRWINVTTGKVFTCKSNGVGAAVWIEEINTTATQTMSGKTLSSPTINNASIVTPTRADAKQDTFANLTTYALTATNGQFCFATDTKVMYQVIDGALADVGGGSGVGGVDIMATDTAEKAVLADYTQTGLEIITSPIILHGTKSFRLIHQAASTRDFKKIIPVDTKFRGKGMTFEVDVVSSALSTNLTLLLRDETNAVDIGVSQQVQTDSNSITATVTISTPALTGMSLSDFNKLKLGMLITGTGIQTGTKIDGLNPSTLSAILSQNASSTSTSSKNISALTTKRKFSFLIPEGCLSLSYKFSALQQATLPETYLDDVIIFITQYATSSATITLPVNNNFGPTIFSGITIGATTTAPTKGTIVSDRMIVERIENLLFADYQYQQSSAGSAGSGQYLFTLPNGLSFDTSVITPFTGVSDVAPENALVGYGKSHDNATVGTVQLFAYSATQFRAYIIANTGASNWIQNTYNMLSNANQSYNFKIQAPIAGWLTNQSTSQTIPLTNAMLVAQPDSCLNLTTANGLGSVATGVRRFSDITQNIGSDIAYYDSATDGAKVVIQTAGLYDIVYIDLPTASNYIYIMLNPTNLGLLGVNGAGTQLGYAYFNGVGSTPVIVTATRYLNVGDIIRPMVYNTSLAAGAASFSVSRAGSLKQLNLSSDSKMEIPTHELRFEGCSAVGTGSETATAQFTTLAKIKGDGFDVSNTNGTVITIKKRGIVTITTNITQGDRYLSKNQAVNTTYPANSERLTRAYQSATYVAPMSWSGIVEIGDKIRVSGDAPSGTTVNTLSMVLQELSIPANFSNVLPQWSQSDSSVSVNTAFGANAAGYGSTGTKIRRFANVPQNLGSAITYADSATNGASFTINEDGVYHISYSDRVETNSTYIGISLNASSLSTDISSLAAAEIIAIERADGGSSNPSLNAAVSRYLSKGDVIRPHTSGAALSGTFSLVNFSISKVGKPNLSSVDVTPFVNMKTTDTEYINGKMLLTNSQLDLTGEMRFALGAISTTNLGVLAIVDDSSNTRTKFVALKKCYANISFGTYISPAAGSEIFIYKNGSIFTIGMATYANSVAVSANCNMSLEVGDFITVGSSAPANGGNTNLSILATADNNATASPTQQVSSDTMSFAFKSTAIDPNVDPIGTFNTYTYAANNTQTLATTAPTQSVASMNINGIQLFGKAFNASSTAGNPARFQIFIGKGLKSKQIDAYQGVAKTGASSYDLMNVGAFSRLDGTEVSYNELTGILTLDAAFDGSGAVITRYPLNTEGAGTASAYFVFNASKSPSSVTIPNLNQRIAYISDVKAPATGGGTSVASTWTTRDLNTLIDPTGIVKSLASNQFILDPGEYNIDVKSPLNVNTTASSLMTRLQNITDSLTVDAQQQYISATNGTDVYMNFSVRVLITATKTFAVQYYTTTSTATWGLGQNASIPSMNNVFTRVKVTKIK